MGADEYQALVDSVSVHGVLNPITTYEGMVVDGWHRFKAANEVGVQCPMVELGDVDPQAFVIAQNKDRRHITKGQLALAAAEVLKWRPAGRNPAAAAGLDRKTTREAAQDVGVSERTMRQAKAIDAKAAPVVKRAAKAGAISIERAAEIAQLPAKEQVKALKEPKPVKIEPEEAGYTGPSQAEIDAAIEGTKEDIDFLNKLMEADDKLAAAVGENEKLRAELAVVKLSRDGYMNQCNELIRRVKTLKKKLEKAEAANV
uniref:ParB/Sulfiredoxin domain-containing protein n=1 Tax=Variovorax sp. HH01 TaxID=1084736 RepID=I3PCR4_9BURK|nr:hypothetical protein var094 [Variovorax sp. HH01]